MPPPDSKMPIALSCCWKTGRYAHSQTHLSKAARSPLSVMEPSNSLTSFNVVVVVRSRTGVNDSRFSLSSSSLKPSILVCHNNKSSNSLRAYAILSSSASRWIFRLSMAVRILSRCATSPASSSCNWVDAP